MLKVSDKMNTNDSKLKKNFEEAKKNEQFRNFIDKVKIDDNILMKYTSSLEESSIEFNNCLNCKHLSECQNKIIGYAYLPKINNGKIEFNYKACRYKEHQNKENKHLKNIQYFNIPESLKKADWSEIDHRLAKRKDTIIWLNNFFKNYNDISKGLYLHGNFGCGKTYLIVAMFNELAKKNVKSAIIFWPEFLRNLKTSFDTDYADKMEYIKKVPLLLIDDLGAEVVTSWSRDEILCPILQYRMDEKLPTFITSNLTIDDLTIHLTSTKSGDEIIKAKRIIERIKQLTDDIEMISKNLRN